ncbi:hypothetical protein GCM10010302_31990 [Streptomyces polychromogenes]|uniref:Uncharacterized protein n=1 Tax=Streptomyces polychromogenes TaxID=67342 RepID=A0ABN0VED8_9ACTN
MPETFVDLGTVNAPSGVLVLGMGGWIDQWPEPAPPLSERAKAVAAMGGGHLREWLCERGRRRAPERDRHRCARLLRESYR